VSREEPEEDSLAETEESAEEVSAMSEEGEDVSEDRGAEDAPLAAEGAELNVAPVSLAVGTRAPEAEEGSGSKIVRSGKRDERDDAAEN
jgi:hypothetical protein